MFLFRPGTESGIQAALNRALEIAETAGATALIPLVLARLAENAFLRGQVEEGFAVLERGWGLARASGDGRALFRLAVNESDALLKLARFRDAADIALSGLEPARRAGLQASRGSPSWRPTPPKRCSPAGARPRRRR